MAFSVLFVCTANICRSPLAERLMLVRTPRDLDVVITSAGTHGLVGRAMDEPSARALRELGGDPGGHLARQIRAADIREADLILTAGTEHRSTIVQLEPLAFRRTFTAREFARLGSGLAADTPAGGDAELRRRVAAIAARRGIAEPGSPGSDEIADPFGAPWPQVQLTAAQISAAVDGVVRALAGRPDGAATRTEAHL